MAKVEETLPGWPRVSTAIDTLQENWLAYAFLTPVLLMLLVVLWFPFLRGIVMSFHEWPLGPGEAEFIGLGNYTFLFGWEPFWTSVKVTLIYSFVTFFQVVIAVAAASVVANIKRFQSVVSGLFLAPYAMPPVTTAVLWVYLLSPADGPVFGYLQEWDVLNSAIYWSAQGDTALAVVMFVMIWTFWPFMFLIILATRESIPESYYESAKVYGANRVQTFFRITLPQLKSAILVAVSIRMVWNLAKISQPFTLTRGGPGYDTSILAVLLYRLGYRSGQLGLAYTIGLVLLVITLAFVALFIREFEREAGRAGA
jgi:ABC-type sugar transport system permease subunit